MAKIKWSKALVVQCFAEDKLPSELQQQPNQQPANAAGQTWSKIISTIRGK